MTIDERFNLAGKVAAVIGGAGHLCSTLAKALSESGVKVVILDIHASLPVPAAAHQPPFEYLECDTTSKESLVSCRDEILARHGHVDILLNGATSNAPTTFLEISAEEMERILAANVKALFFSCQVFGEPMLAQRAGSIINFASASSGPPLSKAFVYSVAKAGVVSITQNLALVLGLQGKYDEAKLTAARGLPADKAAANVDYMRSIVKLDAKPLATASLPVPQKAPVQATQGGELKGTAADDGAAAVGSGWSTQVATAKAER